MLLSHVSPGSAGAFAGRTGCSDLRWLHSWVCEDTSVAWEGHFGIIKSFIHVFNGIIDQRLADILIVNLIVFVDS